MAGSRWEQARDSIMDVAEQAAKYDADGVDVYFLNDQRKGLGLTVSGLAFSETWLIIVDIGPS
jgi:hypothetical protein